MIGISTYTFIYLQVCTWRITTTSGNIKMLFSKFNIEANSQCANDYLQVSGPVKKYRKVKICGTNVSTILGNIIITWNMKTV